MLESRVADAGGAIRRRRECLACAHRFTTYERVEIAPLWVTKHDGRQEPFDRDKVLRGLVRACNKRGVPSERLEALVIEIEARLREGHQREVASDRIGELALEGLLGVDDVAYVRFASVYRAYGSVDEFRQELELIARVTAGGEPHGELARAAAGAAATGESTLPVTAGEQCAGARS